LNTTRESNTALKDIAEAVAQVFDVVCSAVIIEGQESPIHCVGDQDMGQFLVQHPSVAASLADRQPKTEKPSAHVRMKESVLIGIEPLSNFPEDRAIVLVFALRNAADIDRAVALAHALATETARELMVLRQAPFMASAMAEVECGITIADPNLEDAPLIYVNDAFTRMTGYTRARTLGRNCRFLQGHLRDQPGIRIIHNAMARGVDCTTVITNFRANGEAFENRLRLRPIRASNGSVSHIIGIQDDVTKEQSALASLDLQKRRYESLVESVSSYVWHMNADGQLQRADPRWLKLAGVQLPSGETADWATIHNALTSEASEAFRRGWIEALQKTGPFEVTYQLPAESSSPRWFHDRITPVLGDDGRLFEWFGVSQEITALKRAEKDLERIIQAAPTGMLVVNREGEISLANAEASRLFGYSVEELTGMSVDTLVPTSVRVKHQQLRSAFLTKPSVRQMSADREVRGLRKDGTEFVAEIGLSWFGEGDRMGVVAAINDKTELSNAREAVERAAYQDRLTGLLSREGFASELDSLLTESRLHPASLVVSIDISGLREINNAQGYEVGDQVLRETARRMTTEIGEPNLVAHPGGGEFLVLATVDRQHTRMFWRQRLEAVFDSPFEVQGFPLFISVACGYVRLGHALRGAQTLMNDAELALRQSQNSVSRNWTQYTRALERQTRAVAATTRELRQALQKQELMVYYQPQINMASGDIISAEALLRWQHDDKGFIPPDEFIPLAEKSQLIGPIGEWVLRQVCSDLKAWQNAGLNVKTVSLNVSLAQFQLGRFPELVKRALADFGIEPHHLMLEITESFFEADSGELKADLYTLSSMGVRLSLDDFGTGYSSLSHLKNYPFNEIKIDKSFVWQLNEDGYGQAIVRAVQAVAESIGAQTVAEGVESAYHAKTLQALGCNIGQGFYFNRPMSEALWRQLLTVSERFS
jgi:PAS domain S-box-containing protein/diguanylate cyclase (GGDEF)-like protein